MEYGGINKSFRSHEASFRDFASHVVVNHVINAATPATFPGRPRDGGGRGPAPGDEPVAQPLEKIGIVGAGVAGLYAAMILEDLGVPYEIIEANDRIGGRIYTYRFNGKAGKDEPVDSPARYDYFDVGAMRYPRLWFMERVFDLFKRVGISELLREYKYSADNTILYYNTRRQSKTSDAEGKSDEDPFHVSETNGGTVADPYVAKGVDHWTDATFDYYKNLFMKVDELPQNQRQKGFEQAWSELMKQDHSSTRGYMLAGSAGKPDGAPAPFPGPVVEWLETFDSATGLYDQAFAESVIDALDFSCPNPQTRTKPLSDGPGRNSFQKKSLPGSEEWEWVCIDGGSDKMIDGMLNHIQTRALKSGKPVTRIGQRVDKKGLVVECGSTNETFAYSQVILTAPLGCIQSLDLDDCDLLYNQKLAIRSLQYDASTKVGIKFETRWWEDPQFMNNHPIVGGISNTDLPIRVCVYPSYGLNCSPTSRDPVPGVLLASYTWAQDARRLGSLAQGKGTKPDEALVELVLDNIAKLHGIPRSKLPQPVDHFAHSWYNDQYARGAFALFGPAQFGHAGATEKNPSASMFASMKAPAADGKLHFAGEATSAHHAWVLGSLNSAWRAVFNTLLGHEELQKKLIRNWGIPDEEGANSLKRLAVLARYKLL